MKVLSIIEQEDGSAIANVEMSQEEHQWLLEYAFKGILQSAITMEQEVEGNFDFITTEIDLMNLEEIDETHFVNDSEKEDAIIIDDDEDLFEGETDL